MINSKDNIKIKLSFALGLLALFFFGYYIASLLIYVQFCVIFY